MGSDSRVTRSPDSYWKSILSDMETLGILRGISGPEPRREPKRDGHCETTLALPTWNSRIPPATLLQAAWAIVLARHMGGTDVLYFTSLRNAFVPLRVKLPITETTAAWLAEFVTQMDEAESVGAMAETGRRRLAEEHLDRASPAFVVATTDTASVRARSEAKGPLLVIVSPDSSRIEIDYDSAWFSEAEARSFGDHLHVVMQGLATSPDIAVGHIPILTDEERRKMLVDWNQTTMPFAENACVHEFFEEQARRTPDAVALVFCDRQWTYRQLDFEAEAIARRLRAAGVGPGSFVAVCVNRSLELMSTLLGVMKAGGAYIPLDPAYPPERIAFMIDDAKPAVIAVSRQTEGNFTGTAHRLFRVDPEDETAPPPVQAAAAAKSNDAAYVLYTSGSTGKPKGVVITHRNVSNFFTAMDAVVGTDPGVWLAVTSVNFDISVFELFWTLARGFRVILQEEGQWVSQAGSKYSLPQQMKTHGVTHLQCTPSLASMLISDSDAVAAIKPLRRFMAGGEPLPLDLANRLADLISGELVNLYGPTETTVWSAAQKIARRERQVLIGRPVANTQLYVLDPQRELVPVGTAGELYIGGEGLAREYLHRPDLTAERFVTHEFVPGHPQRLYRTGDLVRHVADGRIEFTGRMDQQIKIRGVRVELGEIEAALREHADVRDAVVMVQGEGEHKRLVAFAIAATAQTPAVGAVQRWLGTKLPKILVPAAIRFLPEFPKTPNGKLDRRALARIEIKSGDTRLVPLSSEAGTELENEIAAIWSDVLNHPAVGLDDRFFDIGGHSLLMVEVHDQLRDKAGHDVPLLDLFQYPTVRTLAGHIRQRRGAGTRTTNLNRGKLRLQMAARQHSLRRARPPRGNGGIPHPTTTGSLPPTPDPS